MRYSSTNYNEINLKTFENFKNIKVIIFDFDGTLYKYLEWKGYNQFFIKGIRKLFPELSDDEFNFYIKKYKILNGDRTSERTAKLLLDLHNSTKGFYNFLKTVDFACNWEDGEIFPQELLEKLSKKYKLIIVSNSAEENIKFVSKNMGIDLKYFKEIISNQFKKEDLTKAYNLKKILKKENVLPSQILMVGDSYKYDLKPARELGFRTLLIKDNKEKFFINR